MVAPDLLRDPQVRKWLDGGRAGLNAAHFRQFCRRCGRSRQPVRPQFGSPIILMPIRSRAQRWRATRSYRYGRRSSAVPTDNGNRQPNPCHGSKLIEWAGYEQAEAFRPHKVINEPDFSPLHIVRLLAETATLVRTQRNKLAPLRHSTIIARLRFRSLLAYDVKIDFVESPHR